MKRNESYRIEEVLFKKQVGAGFERNGRNSRNNIVIHISRSDGSIDAGRTTQIDSGPAELTVQPTFQSYRNGLVWIFTIYLFKHHIKISREFGERVKL